MPPRGDETLWQQVGNIQGTLAALSSSSQDMGVKIDTIVAAIADLKAQMFGLKVKVATISSGFGAIIGIVVEIVARKLFK